MIARKRSKYVSNMKLSKYLILAIMKTLYDTYQFLFTKRNLNLSWHMYNITNKIISFKKMPQGHS